mmetsp:Transcript_6760/g.14940  ORF Transcript_6760/g.14940 Transcript_6760/m.14940 type:complete len:285 (-) Transcript_6760:528-1382(-)
MAAKADKGVEDAILDVLRKYPEGANQEILDRELGAIPLHARADGLNRLLTKSRIQLFHANNSLVYKEVAAEEAAKFKGLNAEELMLYQVIKSSATTGVWTKDMKARTNLAQPHITKILKVLETRKLVKSVKNVNNPSRKVYMLYELEPSRDLTGGAWYTENQFDSEFIEVLREACFQYIQRQGDTTLSDIAAFIRLKGFSKVDLREEDIGSIVNTLIYDGRVDQVDGEGEHDVSDHYRPAVHSIPASSAFTSVPCGVCPVFNECHEDGLITPQTCVYYEKWLQF